MGRAPKISPALFDAVGLRIVVAMSQPARPRSDPIPIRGRVGPARRVRVEVEQEEEGDDVELSESYTCVTARGGGGEVRRWVYFEGEGLGGAGGKFETSYSVVFESPPPPPPGSFLSCCCLCGKKLHGLDIFMYRGEKGFCSAECRCQQIMSDAHKENCRKPRDSPVSPCFSLLPFSAGIAAA